MPYFLRKKIINIHRMFVITIIFFSFCLSVANADYTTVNIDSFINGQISANPQDVPVGLSTGNTGSNIPFLISLCGNMCSGNNSAFGSAFLAGNYSPGTSSSLTIPLNSYNLSGQVSFYLLLNNYFGTPGANEYTITINYLDNTQQVFNAIGGQDTRDYNENPSTTNTLTSLDTANWWTNIATQSPIYQRLDVRALTLNSTTQITGITLTQLEYGDPAFLSGLTFSTLPAVELPTGTPRTLVNILPSATNYAFQLGDTLNSTFEGGTLYFNTAGTLNTDFIVLQSGGKINLNSYATELSGNFASLTGTPGSLEISGGDLTLSGDNSSFSGDIIVEAGANLIVESAYNLGTGNVLLRGTADTTAMLSTTSNITINNPIQVTLDPTFNVLSGTTATITSPITDGASPGDVFVIGGGVLELTAANTYTGVTNVNSSTLALSGSGSIANSSAVTNNGIFDITGVSSNVTLTNFIQGSTGTLLMNFSPTSTQQLNIGNSASLDGNLYLNASPGTYSTGIYPILTANTVTGAFDNFSTNLSTYTSLFYTITYDINNLYLIIGPSYLDTQASLNNTNAALQTVFTTQNAILTNSLAYDCLKFSVNGVCLSIGGQKTSETLNSGLTDSELVIIAAYSPNPHIRFGVFIDQRLYSNDEKYGIKLDHNTPLAGGFAVWSERRDNTGIELKLATAVGQKNAAITRQSVGTSENGTGSSQFRNFGAQLVAKYGIKVFDIVIIEPFLGLRYTQSKLDGYAELTSPTITSPLTYDRLTTNATTLLAGVSSLYEVSPKISIFTNTTLESDINTQNGVMSASGLTGITPINFNPNPVKSRVSTTLGTRYNLDKNQTLSISTTYRQEPFKRVTSNSVFLNYTIGF